MAVDLQSTGWRRGPLVPDLGSSSRPWFQTLVPVLGLVLFDKKVWGDIYPLRTTNSCQALCHYYYKGARSTLTAPPFVRSLVGELAAAGGGAVRDNQDLPWPLLHWLMTARAQNKSLKTLIVVTVLLSVVAAQVEGGRCGCSRRRRTRRSNGSYYWCT